jgi:hypothetical protein
MPRGRPRKQQGQADGKAITKLEAVRRALSELGNDAKPLDIQKHIKGKFGVNMDPSMISNYKSSLKGAGKSRMIRKPGGRAATAGGLTLQDIQAVKELTDRIGGDKVRELAEVLSK